MRSDLVALARVGRWLTQSWAVLRFDRLIPLSEARHALAVIGAEVFTLVGELSKAEARHLPLAQAVRDPGNYPHLARVHQGLEDVLTLTLPEPLRSWAEEFVANPPVELLETIDATFARSAINAAVPAPLRRLARFGLFEAVRVNLVVVDRLAGEANLAASGMTIEDLDEIAEREVEHLLDLAADESLGPPSLAVAVKAGMLAVGAKASEVRCSLRARLSDLDAYARAEAELNRLDAVDAILLRAWAESPESKLDPHLVLRQHSVILADTTPGALSTRLSRLRTRLPRGERPRRREALVDIFARAWRNP